MRTIFDARYVSVIDRLCRGRREIGLTQAEAAGKLGWHRTVISNIETKQRRADILETFELCELYGVGFTELEGMLKSGRKSPPG